MSDITTLYDRNHDFAVDFDQPDLSVEPRISTIILTCIDSRVDPAHFLNLELGDAIVIRNPGGRVTDAVERELAMLFAVASQMSCDITPEFSLAIIQHTECGLEQLASPEAQRAISRRSGVALEVVESLGISDHNHSLAGDVDRLRRSRLMPDELTVSAHLYNVKSGRLNQVIAPTLLREPVFA